MRGGFTAYVPSLPGCISEGDTQEEALANIQEAIRLYLEPD
ncbi:MAG: type II toxin-antitoxin system HicB family antitoxin [Chloroflexota bacterium]